MDCVYLVHADNGEVKIGLSGTPYARLSKIKREYSQRRGFKNAYLVGFVQLESAYELELFVHHKLKRYACGGEWYNISPLLAFGKLIDFAYMFSPEPYITTVGPSEETRVGKRPITIVKS
jgi:hypothetical protein